MVGNQISVTMDRRPIGIDDLELGTSNFVFSAMFVLFCLRFIISLHIVSL